MTPHLPQFAFARLQEAQRVLHVFDCHGQFREVLCHA